MTPRTFEPDWFTCIQGWQNCLTQMYLTKFFIFEFFKNSFIVRPSPISDSTDLSLSPRTPTSRHFLSPPPHFQAAMTIGIAKNSKSIISWPIKIISEICNMAYVLMTPWNFELDWSIPLGGVWLELTRLNMNTGCSLWLRPRSRLMSGFFLSGVASKEAG